jgi:hypothetical protein
VCIAVLARRARSIIQKQTCHRLFAETPFDVNGCFHHSVSQKALIWPTLTPLSTHFNLFVFKNLWQKQVAQLQLMSVSRYFCT